MPQCTDIFTDIYLALYALLSIIDISGAVFILMLMFTPVKLDHGCAKVFTSTTGSGGGLSA